MFDGAIGGGQWRSCDTNPLLFALTAASRHVVGRKLHFKFIGIRLFSKLVGEVSLTGFLFV